MRRFLGLALLSVAISVAVSLLVTAIVKVGPRFYSTEEVPEEVQA